MHILVSNDDGILAAGISLLADACREAGHVTVVAPDREQSGTSHALTLHRPLRASRRPDGAFQVDGTPTDCVMLAIEGLMPDRPDFVFSGVNHGPNMGEDVLYSGTVSAAMEAVMLGIPGVAVSYAGRQMETMATYRDFLARLVKQITSATDYPRSTLLNINLPDRPASEVAGVRVTRLGSRVFTDSLARMKDPWGRDIYWIGGGFATWSGDDTTDQAAVRDGFVSITPLQLDMTDHTLLETVRGWGLGD